MFDDIFDGLMLGDGGLQKQAVSARYVHSCKEKDYLEWLKISLSTKDIPIPTKIYEKDEKRGKYYQIYSKTHPYLTNQHNRWYPDGKKQVPKDLELTPFSVLHWYIGDGGLDSDKGYLRQISISAHSFSFEERQFLVCKLNALGFKSSNRKNGLICIKKSSVSDFLDWIGLPPVDSYLYKWDVSKYTSKQTKYKLS